MSETVRTLRVPDQLWERVEAEAERAGCSASEWVRRRLEADESDAEKMLAAIRRLLGR